MRPRQAYWDSTEKTLFVAITSCEKNKLGERTTFRVTNLLPGTRYRLTVDGQAHDTVHDPENGSITVDTNVGAHCFVLQQLSS